MWFHVLLRDVKLNWTNAVICEVNMVLVRQWAHLSFSLISAYTNIYTHTFYMKLWGMIKVQRYIAGTQLRGLCRDFVNVCPAFGTVSSQIKIVGISMSRQQKWLHLALFSHGYIAIVCSSEAYCCVGKFCSFTDRQTHTHALIYTLLHLADSLCWSPQTPWLHDLSKPACRAIQGVANSLQLLQHSGLLLFIFWAKTLNRTVHYFIFLSHS